MIYRAYYHKRDNAPQVWSIDDGNQEHEIHVRGYRALGCDFVSVYQPDHLPGAPSGWIEITASKMLLENGIAKFIR